MMAPERKARIAILAMKSKIERIKLETAVIKGDAVGIATHAKNLAQFQAQAHSVTRDGAPKADHQRTVTIDVPSGNHSEIHNVIQEMRDRGFRI